ICRASFPAAHPDLLPPADCPRRSVELFNRATSCQPLTKLARDSRAGANDANCVTVRLLGDGLLIGEWTGERDGKSELAFVRLLLSHELAVAAARTAALGGSGSAGLADGASGAKAAAGSSKNATTVSKSIRRGASSTSSASVRSARNSSLVAAVPAAALLPTQVTGLSASLILKEHRGQEFVFNTWRCVDLLLPDGGGGGDWLACQLIDPRQRGEHVPYDCEPEFRWRAGAAGLEGRVGDACYCDFLLHSGPSGAGCVVTLWSISEPAFFAAASDKEVDGAEIEYEYDGPRLSLSIGNSTGRLRLLVVKDAIGARGYLVGAWLQLNSHYLALREA
uniref:SHR-BD domain-containing protein n=1 Tax=Macrostomum lignano TaxID=282301 RepID=A0A1I8J2N5_9PLAT